MAEDMMANRRCCPICSEPMHLVNCDDRSDGLKWECRLKDNGKSHKAEIFVRKGSWFEQSNMTLEEILKFSYWWSQDLDQAQIVHELGLSSRMGVHWDSFCREVCEVTILKNSEKLRGEGKNVQSDESKFGKRKYHRGHHVEGQWVFGAIEQDTQKCFMIAVEQRDEPSLLPIIQKWIAPGTIIVSDCWKAYHNLPKYGYQHRTVNHSKEFVNSHGDNTNKMEGQWCQTKVKLPPFGV